MSRSAGLLDYQADVKTGPRAVRLGKRQLAVGAALLLFGLASGVIVQWPTWTLTPLYNTATLVVTGVFIGVGYVAWIRQERRPLALFLLIDGFLWSLQWVTTWNTGVLPVIGIHLNVIFFYVGGVACLLAYREQGLFRSDRCLIVLFLAALAVLPFAVVTSEPEWNGFAEDVWWPSPWSSRSSFEMVIGGLNVLWLIVGIWFTLAAWSCLTQTRGLDRIAAFPIVLGFVSVGMTSGLSSSIQPYPSARSNAYYLLMSFMLLTIPFGLLISLFRSRLQRSLLAEHVGRRLARRVLTNDLVRDELRSALSDPTLELYYWSESLQEYVSGDGAAATNVLNNWHGILRSYPSSTGNPLVIVTGDVILARHRAVLDAVLHASILALENVQLQASLRSQLEQVHSSRARIAEAALEERRRIERDLHDGVQQRLLALQAKVGLSRRYANTDELNGALSAIVDELKIVLRDLRDLAHGIHPPELRQFGVKGAISVMAETSPVQVEFDIDDRRYSPAIEAALYFIANEAIANAVAHAKPQTIRVRVQADATAVRMTIEDDGRGGAVVRKGRGLEGLADRVKTLGGEFNVASIARSGTSVTAVIPCESSVEVSRELARFTQESRAANESHS